MTKFIIPIALWTFGAAAQVTLNVDLELTGGIQGKHHAVRRGGIKCKGGPGPVYYQGMETVHSALRLEATKTMSAGAGLRLDGEGEYLYAVKAKSLIEFGGRTQRVKLTLSETTVKHHERTWGSGCEHNHYNQYLQSAGYHGQVTIRYEVPANTWAIRVIESKPNDVFSSQSRRPFDKVLMSLPDGEAEVLWVRPGDVIERKFDLDASANARRGPAAFEATFEQLGTPMTALEIQALLLGDQFIGDGAVETWLTAGASQEALGRFWSQAISLLRSRSELIEALRTLPIERLNVFTNALFKVAMRQAPPGSGALGAEVRTVAALLSYEVASLFIEEMAPYCERRDVNIPYTGERVNILGARYASFLLSKLSARLSANILVTHQAFIDNLIDLRKRGYTYAMVSRDERTRLRLTKSFKILREVTQPWRRPFLQARLDLVDFYKVFPSKGTGRTSADQVLEKMQRLANKEDEYLGALFDHVERYSSTNDTPLDTANLERLLGELKAMLAEVTDALNAQGRFLSVEGNVTLDSLMGTLVNLKTHNFAVVARAYENVPFDFPFENVRKAYVDGERMTRNLKTVEACAHDSLK